MALRHIETDPRTPDDPAVKWALATLCILAVLPVALVTYVPANDYPFHAARIAILSQLGDPAYDRYYDLGNLLLPNVAMDMVSVGLATILGHELASRTFVALCLVVTLLGTALLHRAAHGRWSAWPLLASILLYNGIFYFGFYNYLFGAGLALAASAGWLLLRPGPVRLLVAFLCALVLMLCHMEAFGIYALTVGSMEFHHAMSGLRRSTFRPRLLRLSLSAIPFLAALGLFVLLSPTAEEIRNPIGYGGYWAAPLHGFHFALSSTHLGLDAVSWVAAALLAGYGLFALGLRINGPVMLAALMLFMAIVVLPGSLLGSHYADIRLAPYFVMMLIAAVDFGRPSRRVALVFAAALLALNLGRTGFIVDAWREHDRVVAGIVQSFDDMSEGSTLLVAMTEIFPTRYLTKPGMQDAWHPSLKHIGSYAAMSRCRCFVPMTFANPTKQPLAVAPEYKPLKSFQDDNPLRLSSNDDLSALVGEIHRRRAEDWPPLPRLYLLIIGGGTLDAATVSEVVSRSPRHILLRLVLEGRPPA